MSYDHTIEKKLTRVYVALAMTRELARRGIIQDETSNSVLSFIDVASRSLDELWQELWDDTSSQVCTIVDTPELEMLM